MTNYLHYLLIMSLKISDYSIMFSVWSILVVLSGTNLLINYIKKRKIKKWKKNHTIYLKDLGITYSKSDTMYDDNKKELSSND